jgi:hypothetical protein
MYRVYINLKNLPKINKDKIISKDLLDLYKMKELNKNKTIIEISRIQTNKKNNIITNRSSPW